MAQVGTWSVEDFVCVVISYLEKLLDETCAEEREEILLDMIELITRWAY